MSLSSGEWVDGTSVSFLHILATTPPRTGQTTHKEQEQNLSSKGQNPFFPREEQTFQSRSNKQEPTSDNPLNGT
jgi:hypothetical protein